MTEKRIDILTCTPALRHIAPADLSTQDAAVVWQAQEGDGAVELIIGRYRIPVGNGDGLVLVVTEGGLYVTEADESASALPTPPSLDEPPPPPLWGTLY